MRQRDGRHVGHEACRSGAESGGGEGQPHPLDSWGKFGAFCGNQKTWVHKLILGMVWFGFFVIFFF